MMLVIRTTSDRLRQCASQVAEGMVVTRFDQARKAVERGVQQAAHLPHAAPRRNEAVDVVGKMYQAHLVALSQGHVAEHEHGIERMVQQGQAWPTR